MSIHRKCDTCGHEYHGALQCPACEEGTGRALENDDPRWIAREIASRNSEAMLVPGFEPALIGWAQLGATVVALYCRRRLMNAMLAKGLTVPLVVAIVSAADDRENPNAPIIVDLNEPEDVQIPVV
jgi:hypothetical protein